jgi:hypothetical protein
MATARARLALLPLSTAIAIACATGHGGAIIERGTVVDDRGGIIETSAATDIIVDSLDLPRSEALVAVRNAYVALGLVPNLVDPARGFVGIRQHVLSRELQGVPLTTYIDCGIDVNGMPVAANDRIELTMLTEIVDASGRSTTRSVLSARALRSSSGAQMDPKRCSSRRALEAKLGRVARGGR